LFSFIVLLLIVASAMGLGGYPLFGERFWFAETFAAFRLQYIGAFLAFLLWGMFRQRQGPLALLCIIGLLLNVGAVFFALKPNIVGNFANKVATDVQTQVTSQITHALPFTQQWLRPRVVKSAPISFSLLQMNLYVRNGDHQRAVQFILQSKADVVALEELNPSWRKAIMADPALKTRYPHRLAPFENQLGLLSRYPIVRHRVEMDTAKTGNPAVNVIDSWITAQLQLVDKTHPVATAPLLSIIVVHPRHPTSAFGARRQMEVFSALMANSSATPRPLIMAGDFNATPWSPALQLLCKTMQLHNTAEDRLPQPSWPSWLLPARIPLDQILYSNGLTLNNRTTGPDYGSDHLPVQAYFTLHG
jgi:endonuclease/exonuclease/phosphatase (EEP) superfamily protein YafD